MISITNQLINEVILAKNPDKAAILSRFFKTGKGQYGEGDKFLGINVPTCRKFSKKYTDSVGVGEIEKLLDSEFHEIRLIAALILVEKYRKKSHPREKSTIYDVYLHSLRKLNNWDLIDLTADKILGQNLLKFALDDSTRTLASLAQSDNLWERRASMIATFAFLKINNPALTIRIADLLMSDKHDLIRKAVGWMLREMGKRCGETLLTDYLDANSRKLSKTTLRYSIERLSPAKRHFYLKK